MKCYELITLILAIIFGLVGAWLFETFGDLGEWLAYLCAIPPVVYYIYSSNKLSLLNKNAPQGEG